MANNNIKKLMNNSKNTNSRNTNNSNITNILKNLNVNNNNNNNNLGDFDNIDNNLTKPNTNNNLGDIVSNGEKSFTSSYLDVSNQYFLVVAVVIAFILVILIYFFSKGYRVGRTIDTMVLYQSYQTINSFAFAKGGDIRLGDCRIASSYNSALSGYQMLDYTSEDIILSVLRSGARYIEFNVFNSTFGDTAIPVVSNGYKSGEWKMTLNDTMLETCFYTIANNAFKVMDSKTGVPNPEDPLFIGLNLNTNSNLPCLNKIAKLILEYFGEKLLDSKYSFQSSDLLPDIKMKNLSGKTVFFSSNGFQGSKLEEFINYCWDNYNKNPKHSLQRLYYKDVIDGNVSFDELMEFNKYGLTIIVPHIEGDFFTSNYAAEHFFDSGCQFIAMNYQYIDSYIDPYITLFKDASIVLKPIELRKSSNDSIGGSGTIARTRSETGNPSQVRVSSSDTERGNRNATSSSSTSVQDVNNIITRANTITTTTTRPNVRTSSYPNPTNTSQTRNTTSTTRPITTTPTPPT
jgi:hypothetical protein